MAKKNKKVDNAYLAKLNNEQEEKKKKEKEKKYVNPAHSPVGKAIIIILALSMVIGSIFCLIYYIVTNALR